MTSRLTRLREACDHLDQGRLTKALALVGEDPESAGARSVSLVAQGLAHEREGAEAEADGCFERAFSLGVPLPAVLRQCGQYFRRRENFERAYQCFALLGNFTPDAMNGFGQPSAAARAFPAPEFARYSPLFLKPSRRPVTPWMLAPAKRTLSDQIGWEAAAIAVGELGRAGWSAPTLPLASVRDFARSEALVYEELVPSKSLILPPPPAFRGTDLAPVETKTRTVAFCVLEDVVVSSQSNFLLAGGHALLDYQDHELNKVQLDLHRDPIVFATDSTSVAVLVEGGAASEPPLDRAFTLLGFNSLNFGDWLIEFLPKVWLCLERPDFASVPILIDEDLHPNLRSALEFFVGSNHPIIAVKRGEAVRVKQLWTCTSILYCPSPLRRPFTSSTPDVKTLDGEAFASLIAKLQPQLARVEMGSGPKRIYLSRKPTQHRKLINHREVEAWFDARGFDILDPADRTFTEQLQLARGADVIVGPDGSALFISLFARAGTRIGYLNNAYLENRRWFSLAHRSLGHEFSILTGEKAGANPDLMNSDYRIDVGALPGFLDRLLAL